MTDKCTQYFRGDYSVHFISWCMAEIKDRETGKTVWLGEKKKVRLAPAIILVYK